MKKIKFKMPAFSLAEALITLLIVCLITLASIPVLTKKKRSPNEFASGKWMCTINSKGQYVVYSSSDPFGDINNPDKWRVSQNGLGCTFTPPQNAKNFGVTVIGGGGGGRDGESSMKTYLDAEKPTYVVKDENVDSKTGVGLFRLAVIGSGGGGHGSDDEDGCPNCGVGGQGGGGAYWIGEINLEKGENVSRTIFRETRVGIDGGEKCKFAHGRDSGFNIFKIGGQEVISAGSGQSGESTRNKGGDPPDCGSGGAGGTLYIDQSFRNRLVSTYARRDHGAYGRHNINCKYGNDLENCTWSSKNGRRVLNNGGFPCYGHSNGVQIGAFYNNEDPTEYGLGGFGCKYSQSHGMQGTTGTVKLWQIIERPGLGGEAAKLTQYTLVNIKGKLVIGKTIGTHISKIGKGGSNNNAGEETRVFYVNNQGKIERELMGAGGNAGAQDKIVSKQYADGSPGQNSLWVNVGGGSIGKCHGGEFRTETLQKQEYVTETDGTGSPICELAVYELGKIASLTGASGESEKKCPLSSTTNPKGLCVGCDVSKGCSITYDSSNEEYSRTTLGSYSSNYLSKVYDAIENLPLPYTNEAAGYNYSSLSSKFPSVYIFDKWNGALSSTYNKDYLFNRDNTDYTCVKYKGEMKTIEVSTSRYVPAGCDDSGNGTYFGAGGGGGSASNEVGKFGKGGHGAPGAVIIEW